MFDVRKMSDSYSLYHMCDNFHNKMGKVLKPIYPSLVFTVTGANIAHKRYIFCEVVLTSVNHSRYYSQFVVV